jgi:hypothetical protein
MLPAQRREFTKTTHVSILPAGMVAGQVSAQPIA